MGTVSGPHSVGFENFWPALAFGLAFSGLPFFVGRRGGRCAPTPMLEAPSSSKGWPHAAHSVSEG
eukprot:4947140-Alexandrium_andersonii.AAC.1